MFILNLLSDPIKAFSFILAILMAITVHEFMHAFSANFLGDPTARYQGRLTLNPLKHLDPIGTLFLLMVGFGWGRPVPYNPSNLKDEKGEFLVALSGPFSNLALAFIFALPLRMATIFAFDPSLWWFKMCEIIVLINVFLCAFNILPIPPLDGSKILYLLFPSLDKFTFERFGIFILLFILIFPPLRNLIFDQIMMRLSAFLLFLVRGSSNVLFY